MCTNKFLRKKIIFQIIKKYICLFGFQLSLNKLDCSSNKINSHSEYIFKSSLYKTF